MSWLSRVVNVFRADRVSREIDEELQFHLDSRIEDLVRAGVSPEAAEREARRRLGHPLLLRDRSRDIKLLPWLESVCYDVRFGLRMLLKHRVITAAALVSLAVAVGASVGAFSLVDALILRPLPVDNPNELVYLTFIHDDQQGAAPDGSQEVASFNYPLYLQLREASRSSARLFAVGYRWVRRAVVDDRDGTEERLSVQWISGEAFEILRLRPQLGRLLNAHDDEVPGESPVAVVSHRFWMRRLGGSPQALGRWIRIDDKRFRIVGVGPPGFTTLEPGTEIDVWVPIAMGDAEAITNPGWQWFRIWGRRAPDALLGRLRERLQAMFTNQRRQRAAEFAADTPRERVRRYIAAPLAIRSAANGPSHLRTQFERPLWILTALIGLVLLTACSNVASLLVARAAAREREMAVRVSIGAGRGRLIQQLLIESAILAVAATAAGVVFASLAAPAIIAHLSRQDDPIWLDLHLDGRAITFTLIVCAVTTMLCGLIPALRASTVGPIEAMKRSGARLTGHLGVLKTLVAAQVGFIFVVLFVSALFLTSFARLETADPGFNGEGVVLLDLESPDLQDERMLPQARAVADQLLEAVRRQPGVEAASLSGWPLFRGWGWDADIRIPGRRPLPIAPYYLAVSPRFFQTMRMQLLAGRDLTSADRTGDESSAVVVNEAFARYFYTGENPVGRRFDRLGEKNRPLAQEIVGLVKDAKYNDLRERTKPTVYVRLSGLHESTMQVRTTGDPLALAGLLRRQLPRVHPSVRVTDIKLQSALVADTLVRERLLALLSAFFALVVLALAAVGLYGVLSYAVVQRTPEIGIRMALGAPTRRVVRLVLGEVTLATAIGLASGAIVGVAMARFVTSLLFEVKATDPVSFAWPVVALAAAAAAAVIPPALRATRVDPVVALRYE
jgi:predicted permease